MHPSTNRAPLLSLLVRLYACAAVGLSMLAGAAPARARDDTPAPGPVAEPPRAEAQATSPAGRDEVLALDQELARLRADYARQSLRAPLAITIVGVGTTGMLGVYLGTLSLVVWIYDIQGDSGRHARELRRAALPDLIPTVAVAAAGGTFLGVRIAHRRRIGQEIRARTRERVQRSFTVLPEARLDGWGLSLRGEF